MTNQQLLKELVALLSEWYGALEEERTVFHANYIIGSMYRARATYVVSNRKSTKLPLG